VLELQVQELVEHRLRLVNRLLRLQVSLLELLLSLHPRLCLQNRRQQVSQ
jgi:hypothetical protein